jgi:hypothetical protein
MTITPSRWASLAFFAVGALGFYTIFAGNPPVGSLLYIIGAVFGIVLSKD